MGFCAVDIFPDVSLPLLFLNPDELVSLQIIRCVAWSWVLVCCCIYYGWLCGGWVVVVFVYLLDIKIVRCSQRSGPVTNGTKWKAKRRGTKENPTSLKQNLNVSKLK